MHTNRREGATGSNVEKSFTEELLQMRQTRSVMLPVRAKVAQFAQDILRVLFPHFSDEVYYTSAEIEGQLALLRRNLRTILQPVAGQMSISADEAIERVFSAIPDIYHKLWRDAEGIHQGDPAAESVDEVISAYPGFYAIAIYRVAHEFCRLEVPIFPRILTETAHQLTGIDIHPGAQIGNPFFIDHGTGVVVGETTVIGDNVKIYQGVTLGALSVDKRLSSSKRHPTIEDNVVIYSNATILGGETVIGHDSIIGGNVWLTEGIPPYSVVYHRSEVRVRSSRLDPTASDFII